MARAEVEVRKSALEALATGTPVVALARGGLPELVTDGVTGLIADDLQSLLHKLPGLGQISRARCRAVAAGRFGARACPVDLRGLML